MVGVLRTLEVRLSPQQLDGCVSLKTLKLPCEAVEGSLENLFAHFTVENVVDIRGQREFHDDNISGAPLPVLDTVPHQFRLILPTMLITDGIPKSNLNPIDSIRSSAGRWMFSRPAFVASNLAFRLPRRQARPGCSPDD